MSILTNMSQDSKSYPKTTRTMMVDTRLHFYFSMSAGFFGTWCWRFLYLLISPADFDLYNSGPSGSDIGELPPSDLGVYGTLC